MATISQNQIQNAKNKLQQAKSNPSAPLGSNNAGTSAPTYNQNNHTAGWGIGWGAGNEANGFNQWNNLAALQQEQNRMNTVMSNREQYGMGVTAEQRNYADRLGQSLAPLNNAKNNISNAQQGYNDSLAASKQQWQDILGRQSNASQQYRDAYTGGQAYQDYQNIQNATIQDIGNRYGIDFSKDYATQQAEAQAQALRDANENQKRLNESQNKQNLQRIENNLMSANEQLDRNYFQQGLGMGQDQVESGLNAGIAADQALRLQMSRQAAMGDAYRDAGLGRMTEDQRFTNEGMRLEDSLGTINQQALANAESMYRDMLTQGYGMLSNDRNFYADQDQRAWERMQTELDRSSQAGQSELAALQWMMGFDRQNLQDTIANEQWNQSFFQDQMKDALGAQQWQTQFDYGKQRDQIGDQQWQKQFDWGKVMDEAGLTGMYNNNPTWQRVQDQFGMDMTSKEFGLKQAEFAWRQAQAAAANASRGRSSGGGGGGSRSSGGSAAPKANTGFQQVMNQYNKEQAAKTNAAINATKNVVTNHPAQKQQDFMNLVQQMRLGGPKVNTFGR